MSFNIRKMPEYEVIDGEQVFPLNVVATTGMMADIHSPMGRVGIMQCVDDSFASMRACSAKGALALVPSYKLNIVPSILMISRKAPFERGSEYARESQHPGVYCEFYSNRRGRFMRINDSYRHVIYQLNRAAFVVIPPGYPDSSPDLDLGWLVKA